MSGKRIYINKKIAAEYEKEMAAIFFILIYNLFTVRAEKSA